MTDDSLNQLAVWLTPASIQLNVDQLGFFRAAVIDLVGQEAAADLVEAAHGVISEAARSVVVEAVVRHDPLFVARDKNELIARLAGAVLITYLESPDSTRSVTIAALVQSARFAGMQARIDELPSVADRTIDNAGISARRRSPLPRAQRKQLPAEATMAEAVSMVNSVMKRTSDELAAMEKRLLLMDEEINTLWWARSSMSRSRQAPWTSLSDIDRVVAASLEMNKLLSFYPPTAAQLALLHDVGSESSESVSLSDLGKALTETEVADFSDGGLMPLSTAARLWREHGTEPKAAAALYKKAGFDPKHKVTLRSAAEQLLRERHIAESR